MTLLSVQVVDFAHRGDEVTGADRVVDTQPGIIVRILPSSQVVLVSSIVRFFIDHEAAALHLDGVAAANVAHQVRTFIAALKMAPREVLVLIEDNLNMAIAMAMFRIDFSFIEKYENMFNTKNIQYMFCLIKPFRGI